MAGAPQGDETTSLSPIYTTYLMTCLHPVMFDDNTSLF